MPSPDANRVHIGEGLFPELECPKDLPEKLKMLLELFDAAQWHYHRTPERQGPISDDPLRIEVERDDVLVTLPGTSYAVKWCKLANQLYCKEFPMEVDRRSPMSQAEFIGKAWRIANEKARDLGWIR